jgi:dynein heavy chain
LRAAAACRDLLEVCEAQLQFVPPGGWPVCGGSRGPEVHKSLADITASFQQLVAGLRRVSYNVLDPNVTRCDGG